MRSGDAAGASGAARPMDAVAHGETRIARAETQIERLGRTSLVFTDNPEHARLRALVNRAFTARAIAELRPTVTRVAEELLGRVDGGEPLDLIADFAAPLPVAVLCEWMALPEDSRAEAGPRTRDIRFLLEPGLMKPADLARANAAVAAFTETLRPLIVARRATPGDDLISLLATASTGGVLTDDEVAALCVMCFVAGTETTKYLIGNAVLALLRHPEQAARLRADPALVPAAVAEALRYDCPLQLTKRLATRELEIGGARISAGDQVLLCLGAANRDPEAFDRPDEFDITRTAGDHLAFGHGMHGCLGGALATLQAEIALELLLPADVDLLGTDIDWQDDSFILRGPNRLPVTLRGSTR
ncbi:cytochrome P450 [Nocardia sp. 2]|uniref:Cytochrome P450 n=2 Tax=Nocardia acididurans TaxID=2802282 RepID=A0ABS1MCB8_9NOCA|nr:cytochrome P450 [Nocardia acididurans]